MMMMCSHVLLVMSLVSMASPLTVTRYHQRWTLNQVDDPRVVHAQMTLDYKADNGYYDSAFKSLADSLIKNVKVVEGNNKSLSFRTYERNGFYFGEWFFTTPLGSAGDNNATVIVDYDIYDGINGCIHYDEETREATCKESFSASWANYWSIPVSNVKYTFELPVEEGASDSMLTLKDAPSCCVFSSGNQNNQSQSYTCQCSELDAQTNPATREKLTIFQWATIIGDPSDDIATCRESCTSSTSSSSSSPDTAVIVGALAGAMVTLVVVVCLICKFKPRTASSMAASNNPPAHSPEGYIRNNVGNNSTVPAQPLYEASPFNATAPTRPYGEANYGKEFAQ